MPARKDFYFLISILFLIGGSVTYSLGPQVQVLGRYNLGPLLFYIARVMAVAYLYWFGYLRRTWWQAGIFALVILELAGEVFSIQHYEMGGLLLTISDFGIPLLYALYFAVSKPVRTRTDWWKLAWVVFNFTGSWFTAHEFVLGRVFPLFSTILLFAVFSDFRREEKRAVPPPEQSWDFDKDKMAD